MPETKESERIDMTILRWVWSWAHHHRLRFQYWSISGGRRDYQIAGLYENRRTRDWVHITKPPARGQRTWQTEECGDVHSDRIEVIFDGPAEAGYR